MREFTIRGRSVAVHVEPPVRETGAPDVALIHGAGFDHSVWRFQARALAGRGHRVLAPDLPGHGRSGGPALATIGDVQGWLGETLFSLGSASAVLIGHSMGSLVALERATSAPESVRGIVLLATSDRMQVHPELVDAAAKMDEHAIDLMIGWMHSGRQRHGGHRSAGTWSPGLSRALLEANLGALGVDLASCDAHDPTTAARNVRTPALAVLGSADRMTPAAAGVRLASLIEGCESVVLDGAGHNAFSERAEEVNRAITRFLSGLGGDR
ncbi:MAG TPA: alpha/beta hydrolase [Acidimicrobiia bacterium]